MHSALFLLAAAACVGLLVTASLAVATVTTSMYERHRDARTTAPVAPAGAWSGVERRSGEDPRRSDRPRPGGDQDERRTGGRRSSDRVAPAAQRRAA